MGGRVVGFSLKGAENLGGVTFPLWVIAGDRVHTTDTTIMITKAQEFRDRPALDQFISERARD